MCVAGPFVFTPFTPPHRALSFYLVRPYCHIFKCGRRGILLIIDPAIFISMAGSIIEPKKMPHLKKVRRWNCLNRIGAASDLGDLDPVLAGPLGLVQGVVGEVHEVA